MSVKDEPGMTVGQVAELVGVSVRTLHHWDEIGLAVPSARSSADHRLYSESDVHRLEMVLVYRETGMPLSIIAEVLGDSALGEREYLKQQRKLLVARISHLQQRISAVDQLLRENGMGRKLTSAQRAEILGTGWDPAWEDEAEERWGHTEDWKQSKRKVDAMTRHDWMMANRDVAVLEEALTEAFQSGIEPGTDRANELAELHREWLQTYVDTSISKQVLMARLYTEDPRFQSHYDDRAPGLARWVRDIVEANARANGVDPDTAEWV